MNTTIARGSASPCVFEATTTYDDFNISRGDCLVVDSQAYKFGDLVAARYRGRLYLGIFVGVGARRYLIQPERVFTLPTGARVLGRLFNLSAAGPIP